MLSRKLKWREIDEDPDHQPLISTGTCTCSHAHTYTGTPIKYFMFLGHIYVYIIIYVFLNKQVAFYIKSLFLDISTIVQTKRYSNKLKGYIMIINHIYLIQNAQFYLS